MAAAVWENGDTKIIGGFQGTDIPMLRERFKEDPRPADVGVGADERRRGLREGRGHLIRKLENLCRTVDGGEI